MQQAAMPEDDLYYTEASAGEILRHTREYYNQSLFDIEKALRIRASQIEALEKNNYNNLPGRVYVIGFVRSYAEYLGLDPERMVNLYKSQMTGHVSDPQLHFPAAASESRLPGKWTFTACAAMLVALISVWSLSPDSTNKTNVGTATQIAANQPENTQTNLAQIEPASGSDEYIQDDSQIAPTENAQNSAATATEQSSTSTEAEQASPAETTPPAEAEAAATATATTTERSIKLSLLQNSWVEIRDGAGQTLVSRVLKAGEAYELKNRDDLVMSIGNAGGVEFILSGQNLGPLGKTGEVVRNFPINYPSLQEKYGLNAENAVNQTAEQ